MRVLGQHDSTTPVLYCTLRSRVVLPSKLKFCVRSYPWLRRHNDFIRRTTSDPPKPEQELPTWWNHLREKKNTCLSRAPPPPQSCAESLCVSKRITDKIDCYTQTYTQSLTMNPSRGGGSGPPQKKRGRSAPQALGAHGKRKKPKDMPKRTFLVFACGFFFWSNFAEFLTLPCRCGAFNIVFPCCDYDANRSSLG